jgi:hypothetical protein
MSWTGTACRRSKCRIVTDSILTPHKQRRIRIAKIASKAAVGYPIGIKHLRRNLRRNPRRNDKAFAVRRMWAPLGARLCLGQTIGRCHKQLPTTVLVASACKVWSPARSIVIEPTPTGSTRCATKNLYRAVFLFPPGFERRIHSVG